MTLSWSRDFSFVSVDAPIFASAESIGTGSVPQAPVASQRRACDVAQSIGVWQHSQWHGG